MVKAESFADYLARVISEELGQHDSSVQTAAMAYFLGVSPKTVSEWLRGVGPRESAAVAYRSQLDSIRRLIRETETRLGRRH